MSLAKNIYPVVAYDGSTYHRFKSSVWDAEELVQPLRPGSWAFRLTPDFRDWLHSMHEHKIRTHITGLEVTVEFRTLAAAAAFKLRWV